MLRLCLRCSLVLRLSLRRRPRELGCGLRRRLRAFGAEPSRAGFPPCLCVAVRASCSGCAFGAASCWGCASRRCSLCSWSRWPCVSESPSSVCFRVRAVFSRECWRSLAAGAACCSVPLAAPACSAGCLRASRRSPHLCPLHPCKEPRPSPAPRLPLKSPGFRCRSYRRLPVVHGGELTAIAVAAVSRC